MPKNTPKKKIDYRFWSYDNWYFRLFGRGFSIQPLKGHIRLFSERNAKKSLHIFGHCWRIL